MTSIVRRRSRAALDAHAALLPSRPAGRLPSPRPLNSLAQRTEEGSRHRACGVPADALTHPAPHLGEDRMPHHHNCCVCGSPVTSRGRTPFTPENIITDGAGRWFHDGVDVTHL